MSDALLLILVYTIFLAITLFYRGRVLRGPWWFLLRSFLPNWRFYHRVGTLPILVVRAADLQGRWSDWVGDVPRGKRRLSQLFHNPDNNRLLIDQSLIEHLHADLQSTDDPQALVDQVSYRLVSVLALQRARAAWPDAVRAQFEIRLKPAYGDASAETAVITSPEIALPAAS